MSTNDNCIIREIEYLTKHPDSYEKYRNSCTTYRELLCKIAGYYRIYKDDKEEIEVIDKIIKIIKSGKCREPKFERMISELIIYDFNKGIPSEKDWDILLCNFLYDKNDISKSNVRRVNGYIRYYLAVICSTIYYNYIKLLDSLKYTDFEKYKDIDPDYLAKGYFDMMRLISSFECDPEKAIVIYND